MGLAGLGAGRRGPRSPGSAGTRPGGLGAATSPPGRECGGGGAGRRKAYSRSSLWRRGRPPPPRRSAPCALLPRSARPRRRPRRARRRVDQGEAQGGGARDPRTRLHAWPLRPSSSPTPTPSRKVHESVSQEMTEGRMAKAYSTRSPSIKQVGCLRTKKNHTNLEK